MSSKIIAIDFDGVIHKYSKGWHDGTAYDVPMEGALEMINKMIDQGLTPVVFTTRDSQQVGTWLIDNKFPQMDITNVKPIAKFYIDDRAIRFTNWTDISKYIL